MQILLELFLDELIPEVYQVLIVINIAKHPGENLEKAKNGTNNKNGWLQKF